MITRCKTTSEVMTRRWVMILREEVDLMMMTTTATTMIFCRSKRPRRSWRKKKAKEAKEAEDELKTDIAETEKVTLPSGQEIEKASKKLEKKKAKEAKEAEDELKTNIA